LLFYVVELRSFQKEKRIQPSNGLASKSKTLTVEKDAVKMSSSLSDKEQKQLDADKVR
jgi:hypothetical protein